MNRRIPRGRYLLIGAAVVTFVTSFVLVDSPSGQHATSSSTSGGRTMAEALAILETAYTHLKAEPAKSAASAATTSPYAQCFGTNKLLPVTATPTCFPGRPGLTAPPAWCAAPAEPPATYPGHGVPGYDGYGVPFTASLENVRILTGYNANVAAYPGVDPVTNTTNQNSKDTLYNNPWFSQAYNITGWVSGLLELPSLKAYIDPSLGVGGLKFCIPPFGGQAGQCPSEINTDGCPWFSTFFAGQPIPAVTKGVVSGDSTANCQNPSEPTPKVTYGYCYPYNLYITPASTPPTLQVLGLNSSGGLEVSGTESANESFSAVFNGQSLWTCNAYAPATVSLSTEPPSLPVPILTVFPGTVPTPSGTFQGKPVPDYRPEQTAPSAISGPIRSLTGQLSGNDFYIPAFVPYPQDPNQSQVCSSSTSNQAWSILDGIISGNQIQANSQGISDNYNTLCGPLSPHPKHPVPCDINAAYPGWSQATGAVTVTNIDLPSSTPPGFSF